LRSSVSAYPLPQRLKTEKIHLGKYKFKPGGGGVAIKIASDQSINVTDDIAQAFDDSYISNLSIRMLLISPLECFTTRRTLTAGKLGGDWLNVAEAYVYMCFKQVKQKGEPRSTKVVAHHPVQLETRRQVMVESRGSPRHVSIPRT